jgi:uncharacterized protein (DUF1501 family)
MTRTRGCQSVGLTRRGLLAGSIGAGLGTFGLNLPALLASEASSGAREDLPGFGRARRVILIWLKGGPSHLDTFDPKPDAAKEIRGEFGTIATRASGVQFSDQVPRLAEQADKLVVVRSLTHGDHGHPSAAYQMTTGFAYPRAMNLADNSTREDHPHLGSIVSALTKDTRRSAPPFALVPDYLVVNGQFRSGQNAGMLGARYDALVPHGDPSRERFQLARLGLDAAEPDRLRVRRTLLGDLSGPQADKNRPGGWSEMERYREEAFSILEANRTRAAFDLEAEPVRVRERYGLNFFGQSVLLGRRLLEAGVRLVHVNCMSSIYGGDKNWDTHRDNFRTLREVLLPRTDRAIAELLADLDASGLLAETLVVVTGEFGRTPKINPGAGRDHHPRCFSVLLAGAGLEGGRTYGRSDAKGAAPAECPVTAGELAATIFHSLGIDPATQLTVVGGRPWRISESRAVTALWS